MALHEERPAEFTDDERWARYFTTTSLIALMVLGGFCLILCKICASMRILPLGLAVSVVILGGGAFVFLVPVPEGDLWHGQGTLLVKILARLVVHASEPSVLIRHLPLIQADRC